VGQEKEHGCRLLRGLRERAASSHRAGIRPGGGAVRLFLWSSLLLLSGCQHANQELLEAALRAREQEVRELREELARLNCHNESLQRQLSASWQHPGQASPEQLAAVGTLRRLTLGRATGGYDLDQQLGDEALQVVLEPRDDADHIIKAPGTAFISALEISPEGLKTPFASWTVPPEQLRRSWRQGFFTTGYVLVLPFPAPPHTPQVRVIARLQTDDGRLFEAERDVRLVLRPEAVHEPPSPSLPAPRPVEPARPDRGPVLPPPPEPVGVWQPPSLQGAVRLCRPVAAEGDAGPTE
jgi:hypothetical protein